MGERAGTRRGARLLVAALLALALGACNVPAPDGAAPLRYRDLVFSSVTVTPDQQYGVAPLTDGTPQKLLLDVYQPAGDTAAKRPAFVLMHGGGFATGNRKDGLIVELARRFARRGYVVVSISYRLLERTPCGGAASASRCFPAANAAADDERAAVRWLRANAQQLRIDTNRIAAGGASAGAIASIIMGATPETKGSSGTPGFSNDVRTVVSISGGLPTNLLFTDGDPPMFFWHGTADTVVPYQWAYDNVKYFYDEVGLAFLHFVEGAGHVPGDQLDDMDAQSRNWLYRIMDLGALSG